VLRGLAALSKQFGKPQGHMDKQVDMEELYFLWSLERAAMLYNFADINGKDWYRWGAEILVTNQKKDGWWPGVEPGKRGGLYAYRATLCTSFALLFLKRSHPMKDLTPKLPFTAKQLERTTSSCSGLLLPQMGHRPVARYTSLKSALNEGIARLRPSDKFPFRREGTPTQSTSPKGSTIGPSQNRQR
jgi:hypothetical protein